MKKILTILCFVFLMIAPFIAVYPIKMYYDNYNEIAKKYECYPVETCQIDFDNDGNFDSILTADEPQENERHNFRLKVFLNENSRRKEILNINYDQTDGSLRTHVAVINEDGKSKVIIYDSVNAIQYFSWNGERLAPTDAPTLLERKIRTAMELSDNTGGRNQKASLLLSLFFLFALYYLMLAITVGIIVYYQKKLKINLS